MIYVILGLAVLCIIFICLFIWQMKKSKSLKERLNLKTEAYNGLKNEFDLYRKAEQFKHQKEEEVNEKIDDLHSGKLSADDILPKRESCL